MAARLHACSKALGAMEGSTQSSNTNKPDHMCWRTETPKKTAMMVAIA